MGKLRLNIVQCALALLLSVFSAVAAHADENPPQTVRLEPYNGAFVIPVVLNDAVTGKFIVDSGSADVSIPAEVASTLKAMGAITGADFLGSKTYVLADGRRVPSEIYRVASLKIGGFEMRDVTVRVAAEKSHFLLGQSFLSRLRSWSVDNARQVMTFQ